MIFTENFLTTDFEAFGGWIIAYFFVSVVFLLLFYYANLIGKTADMKNLKLSKNNG